MTEMTVVFQLQLLLEDNMVQTIVLLVLDVLKPGDQRFEMLP